MKTALNERELGMINGGRKYEDKEVQEDIKLWTPGTDYNMKKYLSKWGEGWGDSSYLED